MKFSAAVACVAIAVGVVAGCHASTKPPPAEARESAQPSRSTIRSSQEDLRSIAAAVASAPDATAEAEALRRLQKYQADHAMTYDLKAADPATGRPIRAPQVAAGPVRVTVTSYRGQQPVYTFSFVPKDNRNLSILSSL